MWVLCPNVLQITMCLFVTPSTSCMELMHVRTDFSRFDATLRKKSSVKATVNSWNAQVDESLREICHYQQCGSITIFWIPSVTTK